MVSPSKNFSVSVLILSMLFGVAVIYLLIALYSGFLDTTIDHAGHLGGFVTGMIVCLIMSLGGRKLTLDVGGPGRQIRG